MSVRGTCVCAIAVMLSGALLTTRATAQQPTWSTCGDTVGGRTCVPKGLTRREREQAQALYNAPATHRETGPYLLPRDSVMRGALAIIGGPVRIAGTVEGALLVLNGDVEFTSTAVVTGGIAVLGGHVTGADSARLGALRVEADSVRYGLDDGVLHLEAPFDEVWRLIGRGEGGALMADPPAIARLVAAVVKAVDIPVTIKIRTGPDGEHETAVEVARLAELVGVAAVDVHARSVAQSYVGGPDWSVVTRVKQAVKIPVLGSGGVREAIDAVHFLNETGADGVAIGRGCLGNPWIFQQARALVLGGAAIAAPSIGERARVLLQLVEGEFDLYGSPLAIRRLPRVACYFAKFLPDFAAFRDEIQRVKNYPDFKRLVRTHFAA